MEGDGCLVSLVHNQHGHTRPSREKLDRNCVYLDSCLSFYQVLTKKILRNVKTTMMHLKGDCNTGTTYPKRKCWWQVFHIWIVESSITNLLRVLQLKADGFTINYNTERDQVLTTPEGEKIVFKKDTGKCKGFHFIEMVSQEALAICFSKVETARGNNGGFSKKYVGKSISARKSQATIGSTSEKEFKDLVRKN